MEELASFLLPFRGWLVVFFIKKTDKIDCILSFFLYTFWLNEMFSVHYFSSQGWQNYLHVFNLQGMLSNRLLFRYSKFKMRKHQNIVRRSTTKLHKLYFVKKDLPTLKLLLDTRVNVAMPCRATPPIRHERFQDVFYLDRCIFTKLRIFLVAIKLASSLWVPAVYNLYTISVSATKFVLYTKLQFKPTQSEGTSKFLPFGWKEVSEILQIVIVCSIDLVD